MSGDPWEVRELPKDLTLELHGGDVSALVPRQGDQAIRVELVHVWVLVDGAADPSASLRTGLAEVLSRGAHHSPNGSLMYRRKRT